MQGWAKIVQLQATQAKSLLHLNPIKVQSSQISFYGIYKG